MGSRHPTRLGQVDVLRVLVGRLGAARRRAEARRRHDDRAHEEGAPRIALRRIGRPKAAAARRRRARDGEEEPPHELGLAQPEEAHLSGMGGEESSQWSKEVAGRPPPSSTDLRLDLRLRQVALLLLRSDRSGGALAALGGAPLARAAGALLVIV